jgi:hypothetical protein
VYRGEPAGVVASDLTIRLWPLNRIDGDYLGAFLSYLYQTGYWRERAGGASGTMKKITREQLLAQEIRVPRELSVVHQHEIAGQLTRRLEGAEVLSARCREELATIAALPSAILANVFSGET